MRNARSLNFACRDSAPESPKADGEGEEGVELGSRKRELENRAVPHLAYDLDLASM